MRLILMGNGPFAVPAFDKIAASCGQEGDNIVAVVTRPLPTVKSRTGPPPTPVHDWALSRGLPHHAPPSVNDAEAVDWLASLSADLMVVCDFGQILRPETLATTTRGGVNLHGSLLPAFRGAAPVQRALLSGQSVTGVSLIHMTPRLDGGPILTTAQTEILDDETAGELEQRLSVLGVQPTLDAIEIVRRWDGQSMLGAAQDPAAVTKAPRLNKAEARIDFDRPGRLVDAHVRGMQPWPIAFVEVQFPAGGATQRVQVLAVDFRTGASPFGQPGELRIDDGDPVVACRDGSLTLRRVKPSGKKVMDGRDWVRGWKATPTLVRPN